MSFSHAVLQAHNPTSRQQQSNISDILRNMRSQAGQAAPVRVVDGATASLPGVVDFFGAAQVPAPKAKKVTKDEPTSEGAIMQHDIDSLKKNLSLAKALK